MSRAKSQREVQSSGPASAPPAARPRTGASRVAAVSPEHLAALEAGTLASATLSEILALDQQRLLLAVFPELPANELPGKAAGILKRMSAIGGLLQQHGGEAALARCLAHPSDTVRGWACFLLAATPGAGLAARLEAIRPLADDPHFGVREWAWLALRGHLAAELEVAIALLTPWTTEPSERLRRFACEALRPRGVWCAHIARLKTTPELALPILQALRADPAAYVQDSVGNWLNDAGKTRPDWVAALCAGWLAVGDHPATARICKRALRNLK